MNNGVTFEDFRDEWLEDVLADRPDSAEVGRRLTQKLLSQWLDLEEPSDDLLYGNRHGEGGIEMVALLRNESTEGGTEGPDGGHTWYLAQSLYGRAFTSAEALLDEGRQVIYALDGQHDSLSSLPNGLLERLLDFQRQAGELDRIVLVLATVEPLTDEQKQVLEEVRTLGRRRLGTIFDAEPVSVETIYRRIVAAPTHIKVALQANLIPSGDELLVGSISLLNLYDFMKAYRAQTGDLDQLYERNVRRFLGKRGRVNKAIHQTLQQTPERFGLYNNGITVVVADFRPLQEDAVQLVEPYIVNGCQTTRTIWEVCHERIDGNGADPEQAAWRRRASQGMVVTKIVKVGSEGEDLLQAIARYTNSQNAVREKDFLALTSHFKTWAREMGERHRVYLEIQRGGWDSRRAYQRQNSQALQFTQAVNAFDLLKVYGAGWLGEAGLALGQNAAFMPPTGSVFRRIVDDDSGDEPFGANDLYATYLLKQSADKYGFGRGGSGSIRQHTRFLFYLIVMEFLKDILVRAAMKTTPRNLTSALLQLYQPAHEAALQALLDTAAEAVDEYLTPGTDDCIFSEPSFQRFKTDLATYLKWDGLGKSDSNSPRLRSLIASYRRLLGRKAGRRPSPRELIAQAIRE